MIVAVIVTFNPSIDILCQNVSRISKQVDKLIIFDNFSSNREELRSNERLATFNFIFSETNVGLGAAYNRVIDMFSDTYDFIITFDQDTSVGPNLVSNLLSLFDNPKVAIVGPNFGNVLVNKLAVSEVDVLIQSSAVFRMTLFEIIGGFDETYFIDSVDFEFCLRARKHGYVVLMANNESIVHSLGVSRKFFFIDYISHTPLRNYYIARNHVRLTQDYLLSFPMFILKKNLFFILHFFKLILLERNLDSLSNFIKGFINGFRYK